MTTERMKHLRIIFFSACILPAVLLLVSSGVDKLKRPTAPDRERFRVWLGQLESIEDETAGLYPYFLSEEEGFESSADDFLSPMVSAKCILFWLEDQRTDRALRIAERLLYWQETEEEYVHPRAAGALPSQIVWDGDRWTSGGRYYSGDNLLILEALLVLYDRTNRPELLSGAQKIAAWLKEVMCRGDRFGVWIENHFAPMHFVTADGSFDNRIFTNTSFLWLHALRRFGEITADSTYIQQFLLAREFMLQGQSEYGVWFDRYDPGYPAQHYHVSRWEWYGEGGVVVADNAIRAALGACRAGAREHAERFADWLRPEDGAVPAYLDAETGEGRFESWTVPYYDIVVSGLWAVLAEELGREKAVWAAEYFLARTQNLSGGWYWGRQRAGLHPVQKSEAVLTGFWAVSDLDY